MCIRDRYELISQKYGQPVDVVKQVLPKAQLKPDLLLSLIHIFPVDGIVIVTSPQELVNMIVKKAYNMAEAMHITVLGVVENFSYLKSVSYTHL